jgi:CxxC motif-containing protein (DUF1111 family)
MNIANCTASLGVLTAAPAPAAEKRESHARRRDVDQNGETLFSQIGCDTCHTKTFQFKSIRNHA